MTLLQVCWTILGVLLLVGTTLLINSKYCDLERQVDLCGPRIEKQVAQKLVDSFPPSCGLGLMKKPEKLSDVTVMVIMALFNKSIKLRSITPEMSKMHTRHTPPYKTIRGRRRALPPRDVGHGRAGR